MPGFDECGNELCGCVKYGKFLKWLWTCYFLKEDSALRTEKIGEDEDLKHHHLFFVESQIVKLFKLTYDKKQEKGLASTSFRQPILCNQNMSMLIRYNVERNSLHRAMHVIYITLRQKIW